MEIGIIGLGRMGGNMAQRLLKGGHTVVAFDFSAATVENAVQQGALGAKDLKDLVAKLAKPRAVWLMVPSGNATEKTVNDVAALLSPGDTIIDGGNSNYKESMRRAQALKARGIFFLDAGTSGGIWGLKEGYCLMVGGEAAAV
jgi:6-phosphogluconate dehydrogenase